ncbi:two-component response regulator ARR14-like [Vigna umbellata]|uniref:two-component response regulator ARR14-like n=1 Tax=Vigna umbellata TaxID=87088 RepID=UPI001F5FE6B7|nr:two-component response regulator ARR14-like [Vigna umbellata]
MVRISFEKAFHEFPSNLRILAVDTDSTVLEFIKKICNKYCYEVITCTESLRATEILQERKHDIDLVLMEVHMPKMDGHEFLLANQKIDVPIIVMSWDDNKKSVMKSIKLGGCDYWIKPLHEDRLKNMWTHVVRKSMSENRMRKDYLSGNSEFVSSSTLEISRKVDNVGESPSRKKSRMIWTSEVHGKFVKAVNQIGLANAVPKKLVELMNVPGLTRNHVASHLQKYRNTLKRKPQQSATAIPLHNHLRAEEALSMALNHPMAPYTTNFVFPQSSETMPNSVSVDTLQQQQEMQQWMESFFL